ncbi:MAG TPA: hypothetical protein VKX31_08070 [Brumimicrobium sp.]|nr:hypothetical protein [Brumimicrobium sp.]
MNKTTIFAINTIGMKGLGRRLIYYGFGLVLGTFLAYFLFGNRSCTWLPQNRVKKAILGKVIVFPEDQVSELNALGINQSTIYNYFLQGKIDFHNSLKEQGDYPKVYVYKTNDTISKRVQFSLYEGGYISLVHVLEDGEEPKQYKELKGWGEVAGIPRDSSLVFIDASNYTQCKARGLVSKDPVEITRDIKETGRINFEKSDLMSLKGVYHLAFTQNDTVEVEAETIWFESRITFKDFFWNYTLDCE